MSIASIGTRSRVSRPQSEYSQRIKSVRRDIMSAKGPRPNPKETAIITLDELTRIKEQCNPNAADPSADYRKKQLEEKKAKHKAQISAWPNTMENIRKKREEDRIKALEEEEMRKRE